MFLYAFQPTFFIQTRGYLVIDETSSLEDRPSTSSPFTSPLYWILLNRIVKEEHVSLIAPCHDPMFDLESESLGHPPVTLSAHRVQSSPLSPSNEDTVDQIDRPSDPTPSVELYSSEGSQ